MSLGTALLDLTRVAQRHRTPVPTALTLLGKTLLNLDGTIRVLSPELDPVGLVRGYMQEVMQQRVLASLSPGRVGAWMLDLKHLVENSPRHVEMALDKLASGQLTVKVGADTVAFEGLQKSARSLTRSMLLSSIIVAAGYIAGSMLRQRRGADSGAP
jgi:ubiquinone biosynthesis protein